MTVETVEVFVKGGFCYWTDLEMDHVPVVTDEVRALCLETLAARIAAGKAIRVRWKAVDTGRLCSALLVLGEEVAEVRYPLPCGVTYDDGTPIEAAP